MATTIVTFLRERHQVKDWIWFFNITTNDLYFDDKRKASLKVPRSASALLSDVKRGLRSIRGKFTRKFRSFVGGLSRVARYGCE